MSYAEISEEITREKRLWNDEGVVILKNFMPSHKRELYMLARERELKDTPLWRPGWPDPTPYLRVPEMLNLALHPPLMRQIALLLGEEAGLHLCLTGFQSTERAWHSDTYLNPEGVAEKYIAVWIALDHIHPDSGPFQWVSGSHKWPVIRRSKVWEMQKKRGETYDEKSWPSDTQGWVGEYCADEIERRGGEVKDFIAEPGDILLWHAFLVHRGSKPKNPVLERPALIAHYSALSARPDMPSRAQTTDGKWYFKF